MWIDKQDMVTRFGEMEIAELTDHQNHRTIDEDVLARAMADACAEAQSYLSAVGLMFVNPPKALVIKTCDIARYYLYENAMTTIVEERYKQAILWLKEVMKHPAMLTGQTPEHGNKNSTIAVIPNKASEHWYLD